MYIFNYVHFILFYYMKFIKKEYKKNAKTLYIILKMWYNIIVVDIFNKI